MLLLASQSASRRKLLEQFGIAFEQRDVDFNEDQIIQDHPKSFAYLASRGKMEAALKAFGSQRKILVADSVISLNGILQRKPRDIKEARAMLLAQSNATLEIITAQILKSSKMELCNISQTSFSFSPFDMQDLEDFLQSNLWEGKAGGIMLEGFHGKYIVKQNGLLSTAMGLSVEKFLPFFGII